jgi:hypothetical protein
VGAKNLWDQFDASLYFEMMGHVKWGTKIVLFKTHNFPEKQKKCEKKWTDGLWKCSDREPPDTPKKMSMFSKKTYVLPRFTWM